MSEIKLEIPAWVTPEHRKAADAWQRARERTFRRFVDTFQFWAGCGKAACRRVHRCTDNPIRCFARHWEVSPEQEKEYWRAAFRASRTTTSGEERHRAGVEAREAYLRRQAGTAPPLSAPKERPVPDAADSEPRVKPRTLPRVRGL